MSQERKQGNDMLTEQVWQWRESAYCVQPADRVAAENAACRVYWGSWQKEPVEMEWVRSPHELMRKLRWRMGAREIEGQAMSMAAVCEQEEAYVREALGKKRVSYHQEWLACQMRIDRLGAGRLWRAVWRALISEDVYAEHIPWWMLQHDMNMVGTMSAMVQRYGVKERDALRGMRELAQSAGWAVFLRESCLLTERPVSLRFDGNGHLHHEGRPSIEYPDRWGVYARHGKVYVCREDWVYDQRQEERRAQGNEER